MKYNEKKALYKLSLDKNGVVIPDFNDFFTKSLNYSLEDYIIDFYKNNFSLKGIHVNDDGKTVVDRVPAGYIATNSNDGRVIYPGHWLHAIINALGSAWTLQPIQRARGGAVFGDGTSVAEKRGIAQSANAGGAQTAHYPAAEIRTESRRADIDLANLIKNATKDLVTRTDQHASRGDIDFYIARDESGNIVPYGQQGKKGTVEINEANEGAKHWMKSYIYEHTSRIMRDISVMHAGDDAAIDAAINEFVDRFSRSFFSKNEGGTARETKKEIFLALSGDKTVDGLKKLVRGYVDFIDDYGYSPRHDDVGGYVVPDIEGVAKAKENFLANPTQANLEASLSDLVFYPGVSIYKVGKKFIQDSGEASLDINKAMDAVKAHVEKQMNATLSLLTGNSSSVRESKRLIETNYRSLTLMIDADTSEDKATDQLQSIGLNVNQAGAYRARLRASNLVAPPTPLDRSIPGVPVGPNIQKLRDAFSKIRSKEAFNFYQTAVANISSANASATNLSSLWRSPDDELSYLVSGASTLAEFEGKDSREKKGIAEKKLLEKSALFRFAKAFGLVDKPLSKPHASTVAAHFQLNLGRFRGPNDERLSLEQFTSNMLDTLEEFGVGFSEGRFTERNEDDDDRKYNEILTSNPFIKHLMERMRTSVTQGILKSGDKQKIVNALLKTGKGNNLETFYNQDAFFGENSASINFGFNTSTPYEELFSTVESGITNESDQFRTLVDMMHLREKDQLAIPAVVFSTFFSKVSSNLNLRKMYLEKSGLHGHNSVLHSLVTLSTVLGVQPNLFSMHPTSFLATRDAVVETQSVGKSHSSYTGSQIVPLTEVFDLITTLGSLPSFSLPHHQVLHNQLSAQISDPSISAKFTELQKFHEVVGIGSQEPTDLHNLPELKPNNSPFPAQIASTFSSLNLSSSDPQISSSHGKLKSVLGQIDKGAYASLSDHQRTTILGYVFAASRDLKAKYKTSRNQGLAIFSGEESTVLNSLDQMANDALNFYLDSLKLNIDASSRQAISEHMDAESSNNTGGAFELFSNVVRLLSTASPSGQLSPKLEYRKDEGIKTLSYTYTDGHLEVEHSVSYDPKKSSGSIDSFYMKRTHSLTGSEEPVLLIHPIEDKFSETNDLQLIDIANAISSTGNLSIIQEAVKRARSRAGTADLKVILNPGIAHVAAIDTGDISNSHGQRIKKLGSASYDKIHGITGLTTIGAVGSVDTPFVDGIK